MTISPPDVPRGVQQPRVSSVPAGVSSAGQDAVDLAASAGLVLDEWQRLVLVEALRERADGKWSAFEVGVVVPRQNGKGSILEALELAALFLPDPDAPPPLILHSAHEFKTSAEHFRRMRDLIEGAPHLAERVRIVRTAAGSESIELHSGARLRFVTRTGGSGRGFSCDLIVIDEAYNLTADSVAAMMPTLSARPNPQIWYTSSAGMKTSETLARLRDRGLKDGGPRLAYFEWSAQDDADLDDRAAWAQANPALGADRDSGLTWEAMESERAAMPDEHFGRERLGLWANENRDTVLPLDLWQSLTRPDVKMTEPVSFSLEVALGRESACIGAAWQGTDAPHVVSAEQRSGTDWIIPYLSAACTKRQGSVTLDGATEAGSFVDKLEAEGIKVNIVKGADRPAVCSGLFDAVTQGQVTHDGDSAVLAAITGASWRQTAEGARTFARKGATDIAPLYAVALALHGLGLVPDYDVLDSIY